MKQVLIKQGRAVVEEVPAPMLEPGTVLVQVDHSCISVGTEMSGIRSSGQPLWKRAISQPGKVKQAVEMAATQGFSRTRSIVQGQLQTGSPTGYSAAGTVLAVGQEISDLQPGDRVACAGAQCAHHAEVIRVPRNLAVRIPEKLPFSLTSTVTLGAIALQGVRRTQPTLGETFVVIGLGILGQLTVQMLRANGCRVIGTDLDRERIRLARELGMDVGVHPEDADAVAQIARLTDGLGADGVIITAATPSDEVMSTAFRMCRKKGRVVLVGDVGLSLNRDDFYQKELDFFISTSYGPGRYDANYEEHGLDYPVAFVRWTENRNMAEYLRMLAEGKLDISPLISAIYPVSDAAEAYESLKVDRARPLIVLLSYPRREGGDEQLSRRVPNPRARKSVPGRLSVALVGAGSFAKGMHLPNLQALSDFYEVRAVMSRTGHNASATARQFEANYATTDYQQILADPDVDVVLVATRHNLHADLALRALAAGKHVIVEKPLALDRDELASIRDFYASAAADSEPPVLLTGFNRRFSPFAVRTAELLQGRSNPMMINYRMNAGYIPLSSWVHTEEGGGRNLGEACHIYDLFTFLTGVRVDRISAQAFRPVTGSYTANDNFVATMSFADGSVATLTYTALGAKDYPKEQMEVFVDGKVVAMSDYKTLNVYGADAKGMDSKVVEKGQKEELVAFANAVRGDGEWPIPLWQQLQATEISFAVEDQIHPRGGEAEAEGVGGTGPAGQREAGETVGALATDDVQVTAGD